MATTESGERTAPAQTIEDFDLLDVTEIEYQKWRVTNRSSGTQYVVDLTEGTCTCPAKELGDASGDDEACKHILKCNYVADTQPSIDRSLYRDLGNLVGDLSQAVERAEDAAQQYDGALVDQRAIEAEEAQQAAQDDDDDDDWVLVRDGQVPDGLYHIVSNDMGDEPPVRAKQNGDGWEVEPHFQEISDDELDRWDDLTGPEGQSWYSPIWPEDYEDGDPPEGTIVYYDEIDQIEEVMG